jgi:hypothetical protein
MNYTKCTYEVSIGVTFKDRDKNPNYPKDLASLLPLTAIALKEIFDPHILISFVVERATATIALHHTASHFIEGNEFGDELRLVLEYISELMPYLDPSVFPTIIIRLLSSEIVKPKAKSTIPPLKL